MVLLENKFIYLPSSPATSRSAKIADYEKKCCGIEWHEESILSRDGTRLALCVGHNVNYAGSEAPHILMLYLQGNGSSTPPRLPALSRILRDAGKEGVQVTLVALSYRGYWTSEGSPSQPGLEKDGLAALKYLQSLQESSPAAKIIVWGQSIGAGVGTTVVANATSEELAETPRVDGMILETPFTSIKEVLVAMYPQKWLPHRHLERFLRNVWDSERALAKIGSSNKKPTTLVLSAGKDEIVPPNHGAILADICKAEDIEVDYQCVSTALHMQVSGRREGRNAIVKFLTYCTKY